MNIAPHNNDMRIYIITFCLAVTSGSENRNENFQEPNILAVKNTTYLDRLKIPEKVKKEVLNFTLKGDPFEEEIDEEVHKWKIILRKGHGLEFNVKKSSNLPRFTRQTSAAHSHTMHEHLHNTHTHSPLQRNLTTTAVLQEHDKLPAKFSRIPPLNTRENINLTEKFKNIESVFQTTQVNATINIEITTPTPIITNHSPEKNNQTSISPRDQKKITENEATRLKNFQNTALEFSFNTARENRTIPMSEPIATSTAMIKPSPQKLSSSAAFKSVFQPTTKLVDESSLKTTAKAPRKKQAKKAHPTGRSLSTKQGISSLSTTASTTIKSLATKSPTIINTPKFIAEAKPMINNEHESNHKTNKTTISTTKSVIMKIPTTTKASEITPATSKITATSKLITAIMREIKHEEELFQNNATVKNLKLVTAETPATKATPKMTTTTKFVTTNKAESREKSGFVNFINSGASSIVTSVTKRTPLTTIPMQLVDRQLNTATKTPIISNANTLKSIVTNAKFITPNVKLITKTEKPFESLDLATGTASPLTFTPSIPESKVEKIKLKPETHKLNKTTVNIMPAIKNSITTTVRPRSSSEKLLTKTAAPTTVIMTANQFSNTTTPKAVPDNKSTDSPPKINEENSATKTRKSEKTGKIKPGPENLITTTKLDFTTTGTSSKSTTIKLPVAEALYFVPRTNNNNYVSVEQPETEQTEPTFLRQTVPVKISTSQLVSVQTKQTPDFVNFITTKAESRMQKIDNTLPTTELRLESRTTEPATVTLFITSTEPFKTLKPTKTEKAFTITKGKNNMNNNLGDKATILLNSSDPANNTVIPDWKPEMKSVDGSKKKTMKKGYYSLGSIDSEADDNLALTENRTISTTTSAVIFTTKRRKRPTKKRKGYSNTGNIDIDKMWT